MPVEQALLPVDQLISAIYSGISETRPWQTFLYHLRVRTDSEVASLSLRRGGKGVSPIVILDRRYEINKADALVMARDYARLVDQDPISATRDTPGKVTNLRDIMAPPRSGAERVLPAGHEAGTCRALSRNVVLGATWLEMPYSTDEPSGQTGL